MAGSKMLCVAIAASADTEAASAFQGVAKGGTRWILPTAKRLNKKPLGQKPLDKKISDKKKSRKPRVDAVRNRERVLEAARKVFSAGGADASLETVAQSAGVGIGTLYRHFPTRQALFEAVYRHEVKQLADLAQRLEKETQPIEAMRQWMRSFVKFVATKKGMSAALAFAVTKDSDLFSYSSDLLMRAVGELRDRAIAAGEIRNDISADDLLHALVGMCYAHDDQPSWQKSVLLLVDVFVDGLCTSQITRATKQTQKVSR